MDEEGNNYVTGRSYNIHTGLSNMVVFKNSSARVEMWVKTCEEVR
ncbi:hypothetical protein ACFS7Z_13180 [Pontibacter toksunensis]|uniref:Uncharacterized protein n=1 Tax=Pontibacter toksunensis TaxID=1332631 RepID=A0ABW6BWE4_9BACT